jgi:hypothetical protein
MRTKWDARQESVATLCLSHLRPGLIAGLLGIVKKPLHQWRPLQLSGSHKEGGNAFIEGMLSARSLSLIDHIVGVIDSITTLD